MLICRSVNSRFPSGILHHPFFCGFVWFTTVRQTIFTGATVYYTHFLLIVNSKNVITYKGLLSISGGDGYEHLSTHLLFDCGGNSQLCESRQAPQCNSASEMIFSTFFASFKKISPSWVISTDRVVRLNNCAFNSSSKEWI